MLLAIIILGVGWLLAKFAYQNLADKNVTLVKVAKALSTSGSVRIVSVLILLIVILMARPRPLI